MRTWKQRISVIALALVATLVALPVASVAQSTVKNYFSGCTGAACDNTLRIGGTIDIVSGGVFKIAGVDVTSNLTAAAGTANGVVGIASGYKLARGTITLDGTNPSSATTGLTAIVSCTVSNKRSTAPGLDPSWLTVATAAVAGRLDVYAWKVTGAGDATLIASTDADDTIDWICIGT